MSETEETLAEFVVRHAEQIKAREEALGAYSGDGPTQEQVDRLLTSLHRQLSKSTDTQDTLSAAHDVFRSAVDIDFSWLFPERDPIAGELIPALREVQKIMAEMLDKAIPEGVKIRQDYVSLSLVGNAARRTQKLQGNGIMWRLVLARFLYWLGGGRRS